MMIYTFQLALMSVTGRKVKERFGARIVPDYWAITANIINYVVSHYSSTVLT